MSAESRVRLRNRMVEYINTYPAFKGCKAFSGLVPGNQRSVATREKYFWRFVNGTTPDGRVILIYPLLRRNDRLPLGVAEFMEEISQKSPFVGTAESLGDVFCILKNDPVEYPRAKKTWFFRYCIKEKMNESGNPS